MVRLGALTARTFHAVRLVVVEQQDDGDGEVLEGVGEHRSLVLELGSSCNHRPIYR